MGVKLFEKQSVYCQISREGRMDYTEDNGRLSTITMLKLVNDYISSIMICYYCIYSGKVQGGYFLKLTRLMVEHFMNFIVARF